MNIDGTNLKQLTMNGGYSPTCSPDGKWVVYVSRQAGQQNLWKVPIDGGSELLDGGSEPQRISDKTLSFPDFSPTNDDLILCIHFNQEVNMKGQPVLVSLRDGQIVKQLDFSQTAVSPPGWMPDGQSLFYVDTDSNGDNVWSQTVADKKRVQLTKFTGKSIGCIEISKGKKIVLSFGSGSSTIILIKNFRNL
jgi:Tol biopolymer transport system component